MPVMTRENKTRLEIWANSLVKDFYKPLGDINFKGFSTFEHLRPEQAARAAMTDMPAGTTWGHEWEYLWIKANIDLPEESKDKLIVLNLKPGAESVIFVDGKVFGHYRYRTDVPHHFFVDNILSERGEPGRTYSLLIEVSADNDFPHAKECNIATGPVFPGEYGPTDPDKLWKKLGQSTFGVWNEDAYGLWLDVTALKEVMESLPESSLRAVKIGTALKEFTYSVDFEQAPEKRNADYIKARAALAPLLALRNSATTPTFYGVGQAHLDVEWLWPYAESVRKTARTFAAQLRHIERYPGYKFLHTQPETYKMCKENYPELYERVKKAIKSGGWIAEGGMWVEPDTNITSGESLIRQLLHGKAFYKEEFDVDSQMLWLPDSFGYSAVLPQILVGCGIKYVVTTKMFWNYNGCDGFPYNYFYWEGIDGTKITTSLPTGYSYTTNPARLVSLWENRVLKDDTDKLMLPFGYGDGGGGPSRDHIEYILRNEDLEGCPKVKIAHPMQFFKDLDADGGPKNTYTGELYLNFHRGTYTSQAGVKNDNRRAELGMREAEMWGAAASVRGYKYPSEEADKSWKKILLNQFHDILPGSSIERVYKESAVLHKAVIDFAHKTALEAAAVLTGDKTGVTVFNSLSWEREGVVSLPAEFAGGAEDAAGNVIPTAALDNGVIALVKVPSCGTLPVFPSRNRVQAKPDVTAKMTADGAVLENSVVKAVINAQGEVVSFILKSSGREFAAGSMNKLLLYKDVPRFCDAWDLDSNYIDQPVEITPDAKVAVLYSTPLAAAVRVEKTVGESLVTQDIVLRAGSSRIDFETVVDWRELHRLLKAAFPMNIHTDEAINEIQFGYLKRPTHRSRLYDRDRYEVVNHRYTALCDQSHGAAVLNDCKYGVSQLGNTVSLSLLRAPACPDMRANNGINKFTYAFTAWEGSFRDSDVTRQGYELNAPMLLAQGAGKSESFFKLNSHSVILETVKPAHDGSSDIVLRLYESKGGAEECELTVGLPASAAFACDMIETRESEKPLLLTDGKIKLSFRAFEIKTIKLRK